MKFHCDHCKAILSVTEDVYGAFVQCPECQKTLKAPFPDMADLDFDEIVQVKEKKSTGRSTLTYILFGTLLAAVFAIILAVLGQDDDQSALVNANEKSPELIAKKMRNAYSTAERTTEMLAYALPVADLSKAGNLTDEELLGVIGDTCQQALPRLEKVDVNGCPPGFVEIFNEYRDLVKRVAYNPIYFPKLIMHPFMAVAAARYGASPEWEKMVRSSKREERQEMIRRGEYPLPP